MRIKLLPGYIHNLMWVCLCFTIHINCSRSSNGSVMHTSIRACCLYFFYNPYMSLLIFTCLHSFLLASSKLRINNYMYMILCRPYQHQLYLPSKVHVHKEGLELLRLLTVELGSVEICVQDLGVPCAT